MNIEMKHSPIIITGVERSGSTLIARILDMHGVHFGGVDAMYQNKIIQNASKDFIHKNSLTVPFPSFNMISTEWREIVLKAINDGKKWAFKSALAAQLWQQWHYAFPDARWVIVRRRSADIVNSCKKTAYMQLFRTEEARALIGVETEEQAWLWWIHQYEQQWVDMITTGLNCKMIWPERMVEGDYKQIYEMIDWLGLEWNNKIVSVIDPLINKNRRK